MAAIFEQFPQARLTTAFVRYVGRESFEQEFPATYWRNAGSQMYPQSYGELCECGVGVHGDVELEHVVAERVLGSQYFVG
jgi:hypothetical protein